MTKDEALDLALEALERAERDGGWSIATTKAITAIKQAQALDKMAENARELGLDYEPVLKDNSNYRLDPPVAEPVQEPVQEPVATNKIYVTREQLAELYPPPAAQPAPVEPDWKAEYLKSVEPGCITLDELREARAELDATNRQVEILSDALAESRREVAALKPVQEPSNYNEFVKTACALIKAADDAAADRDYMLDSDDCIAVLRGTWKAPLANDMPKQPTPPAQPAPVQPVASLKEVDVLMMAEAHGIDPSTKCLYGFYIDCISNQPAAQPAPVQGPWKERFIWLVSQHWVEPEATFRLGLEETDDSCNYERQIIDAIDKAASISTPPAAQPAPVPLTDEDCTRIYNEANGITTKNPPITTQRIFAAMRAANGITHPPAAQPAPVQPVATVIEELEHDGEGFCAKVRWLYNPVPVGETLSWEQPK